jgi:hypothetical protein
MTGSERFVFWFALVNLVAFMAASLFLGGDALNGMSGDGRYFLAAHGKYTEVSESVFRYSRMHALSIFITTPLGIVSGLRARRRVLAAP